jgi:hypothetical protein
MTSGRGASGETVVSEHRHDQNEGQFAGHPRMPRALTEEVTKCPTQPRRIRRLPVKRN